MNKKEDQKELSGRELDAAIHVRVMGFPLESKLIGDGRTAETALRLEPADADWRVRSEADQYWHRIAPDGADRVVIAPLYGESIEAAMQVIEKLRRSGEWCCIEIKSDYHYVWWVSLTPAEGSGNDVHKPTVARQDESLPIAICRAALAAIETNQENEDGVKA